MIGPALSVAALAATTALSPVMPREPTGLPAALPRGSDLPDDHDPLADGILMRHQLDWLEDKAKLKLGEKGRRCGLTYAEALDDTLIAASARSAGGSNVFYIGDTKDKGREFIGYVAHFAKIVARELVNVEEFLFEDEQEDGTSRFISGYRVTFASGFRVEALSSRPENIRGLQGVVVIDEAAFHKDVRLILDAVNALLIWRGRIRIISTHNGVLNPFNELIREAKAGKVPYSLHFVPFGKAVENGLYERTCLITGEVPTAEGKAEWEALIRGAYGVRTAQMEQELDAIPADAEGSALTRVAIEAVADRSVRVLSNVTTPFPVDFKPGNETVTIVRWLLPDAAKGAEPKVRDAIVADFCRTILAPILARLDADRRHDLGSDFARTGDAASTVVTEMGRDLVRRARLVLEMHNVPFEMQRDVLFFIQDRLPRYGHGAFDAGGNGAYIAEVSNQRYGEKISEIKLSQDWYRVNGSPYVEAIGDRTVTLAGDEDVMRDHQALSYVGGVIRVPDDMRYKGEDGLQRHGDTAIAGLLAWFASRQGAAEYGYEPVRTGRGMLADDVDDWGGPDDEAPRGWWRPPLGSQIR